MSLKALPGKVVRQAESFPLFVVIVKRFSYVRADDIRRRNLRGGSKYHRCCCEELDESGHGRITSSCKWSSGRRLIDTDFGRTLLYPNPAVKFCQLQVAMNDARSASVRVD
jgi:hypothetical protein